MALRLVASGDGQALVLRDHLLPVIRRFGGIETQRGSVRFVAWHSGPWDLGHWTPFNDLHPDEAASPGYRHAVERQHTRPNLPYGLDVRFGGATVLRVLWADDGSFEVASFIRGAWESEALTL